MKSEGYYNDDDEIPLYNVETWLYEDFEVGDKVRSIRRTISEGEAMLFNSLVMDNHPYVVDDMFTSKEGMSTAAQNPATGRSKSRPVWV